MHTRERQKYSQWAGPARDQMQEIETCHAMQRERGILTVDWLMRSRNGNLKGKRAMQHTRQS